jgi:hypothetical protein
VNWRIEHKLGTNMLYGFLVAPSINHSEPGAEYFEMVQLAAAQAAKETAKSEEQALALCEYLDCVDAKTVPNEQGLYRRCVIALTNYLNINFTEKSTAQFASKSFAAQTLLELVAAARPVSPLYMKKVV